MPRYIDEKDVYTLVEPRGVAKVHCSQIDELPRADVVPKSEIENAEAEIERLKHILNCYALQYGTVTDQRKVIDEAKIEVAREIFEEIEYLIWQYDTRPANELKEKIAELKKKHIGEW